MKQFGVHHCLKKAKTYQKLKRSTDEVSAAPITSVNYLLKSENPLFNSRLSSDMSELMADKTERNRHKFMKSRLYVHLALITIMYFGRV